MKKQALTVGHIRVYFQAPAFFGAEALSEGFFEGGFQFTLYPFSAGLHQVIQATAALVGSGGPIRAGITGKAEGVLVYYEVDVFGEALDQSPSFGERGAAFEGQVIAYVREIEYFAQCAANPEILVHAGSLQALCVGDGQAGQATFACWYARKGVHGSGGELTQDFGNPTGRVMQILEQLNPILLGELPPDNGERFVIHVALADVPQRLNDGAALAAGRRHVARRSTFEHDFLMTELDSPRGTIG